MHNELALICTILWANKNILRTQHGDVQNETSILRPHAMK